MHTNSAKTFSRRVFSQLNSTKFFMITRQQKAAGRLHLVDAIIQILHYQQCLFTQKILFQQRIEIKKSILAFFFQFWRLFDCHILLSKQSAFPHRCLRRISLNFILRSEIKTKDKKFKNGRLLRIQLNQDKKLQIVIDCAAMLLNNYLQKTLSKRFQQRNIQYQFEREVTDGVENW